MVRGVTKGRRGYGEESFEKKEEDMGMKLSRQRENRGVRLTGKEPVRRKPMRCTGAAQVGAPRNFVFRTSLESITQKI